MLTPLVKSAAKRVLKSKSVEQLLNLRAVDGLLSLKPTRRLLGDTPLYPHWARALRGHTAGWEAATPDWTTILRNDWDRWQAARTSARGGKKILIATSAGGFSPTNTVESMLAVALTLRGAEVHVLLCDQHLPACFIPTIAEFPDAEKFAKHGPQQMCDGCYPNGYKLFRSLGLPLHRHSELISRNESRAVKEFACQIPSARILDYRMDGLAVGEHALASALHFYARGKLDKEVDGEAVLRRYFHASLLTIYEIRRLLSAYSFSCVCSHHGIYVPHGLFGEVARQQGVRSVSWSPAYRSQTFIFSHQDTYHRTMLSEATSLWENIDWTPEMETEIVDYLKSRWKGTRDWISYQAKTQEDLSAIATETGIDFSKPVVGLLTNVTWDAQVNYPGNALPDMVEWVIQTIRYFSSRSDLQLLIRIHPAEVLHPNKARDPILGEIKQVFPKLPPNVFVIPPEKLINTYAAMLACDSAIIYATKTGIELASIGIPVIVAGQAWIRGKGISLDPSSLSEYFQTLDRLPLKERLSEATVQRARRYAYHFFFRRMIPLPFVVPPYPYTLELSGLEDLLPGKNIGLDVICDGILEGNEFIYPAELYPETLNHQSQTNRVGKVIRIGAD
jgi:hypothetical protein